MIKVYKYQNDYYICGAKANNMTQQLKNYTDYRNLTATERLAIYQAVKATNPKAKSVTKLDRLCFSYFLNNVYGK